jgi:hypothetical protein
MACCIKTFLFEGSNAFLKSQFLVSKTNGVKALAEMLMAKQCILYWRASLYVTFICKIFYTKKSFKTKYFTFSHSYLRPKRNKSNRQ